MSTRIVIEAISPEQARLPVYAAPLSGDWYWSADGTLIVQVVCSDVFDQLDGFLVALHELFEARACFQAGITQGALDAFDQKFEQERVAGLHDLAAEPGDSKNSPYRVQHRQAMLLEHLAAFFFGLTDYGDLA